MPEYSTCCQYFCGKLNFKTMMNQMNNTDGYRRELREIEDRIKSIVGPPDHTGYIRALDGLEPETLDTLENLLDDRKHCLNCLFRSTDGEIARFKKLNDPTTVYPA